ncbi:MAG: carboxypeptidase regulatory-like domain-containing protein [Candidatus Cloacimonadota bacterium]|nr:carboxypeptidase regulatory-like domain-containing protein [Candidatus Cloacimonadota bacterium]
MKLKLLILLIIMHCLLFAVEYQINLSWDEFEGECNGFISGSIGKEHAFLSGGGSAEALDGKLISVGEGMSTDAQQVFKINSNDGFFTFWIKDKFADDDMNSDPNLISMSKPMISVFKDGELIDLIKVPQGAGLACKVFTLDASTGEVDREIKYYPKSRIIVGSIVDAVTGDPLKDAKVSITDYMKQARQTITDETGIFVFEVEIGQYRLDISKEEYIGTFANVRMGADETPREIVCALSPEIKEFRIVLTWGSRPKDLDAHLSGPNPDGGDFHIWYRNRYPIGGKDFLDRDDMDKYGPETVTIYKPAVGNYRYSVHDYSNKKSKRSKNLSRSNAQVFVYGQNKLLASFEVPHNFRGNCWHVFEINEKHAIIPINKIEYVKDAVSIH